MAKRNSRSKAPASASDHGEVPKPRSTARTKRGMEAKPVEAPYQPTQDEIRHRAYERFLERGGADGTEFDDWLQAEQELRRKR